MKRILTLSVGGLFASVVTLPLPSMANQVLGMTANGVLPTCEAWTELKGANNETYRAEQLWVLGFLSGLNINGDADFLQGTKPNAIFSWLDSYCSLHPDVAVHDALNQKLRHELER